MVPRRGSLRIFRYRTRDSWSRERRVVGKAEHLPHWFQSALRGDLAACGCGVSPQALYCARGDMENRIMEQLALLSRPRGAPNSSAARESSRSRNRHAASTLTSCNVSPSRVLGSPIGEPLANLYTSAERSPYGDHSATLARLESRGDRPRRVHGPALPQTRHREEGRRTMGRPLPARAHVRARVRACRVPPARRGASRLSSP